MRRSFFYGCLVIIIIMFIGCDTYPEKEGISITTELPVNPEVSTEPPKNDNENTEGEFVKGIATRIDRVYEEYDYSGWYMIGWFPGVLSLIPDGWADEDNLFTKDNPDGSVSATRKDAIGSEISWSTGIEPDTFAPVDVVMIKVAAIQDEGVDVEYGEFRFNPLPNIKNWIWPDGYYYKRSDTGLCKGAGSNTYDIQVFFTSGSETDNNMCSFSLKLSGVENASINNFTYEVFFMMANSLYEGGQEEREYFSALTGIAQKFRDE